MLTSTRFQNEIAIDPQYIQYVKNSYNYKKKSGMSRKVQEGNSLQIVKTMQKWVGLVILYLLFGYEGRVSGDRQAWIFRQLKKEKICLKCKK